MDALGKEVLYIGVTCNLARRCREYADPDDPTWTPRLVPLDVTTKADRFMVEARWIREWRRLGAELSNVANPSRRPYPARGRPILWTPRQLAARLGVSPRVVRGWLAT